MNTIIDISVKSKRRLYDKKNTQVRSNVKATTWHNQTSKMDDDEL